MEKTDQMVYTKQMGKLAVDANPPLQGLKQACACTPDPKFSGTDTGVLPEPE